MPHYVTRMWEPTIATYGARVARFPYKAYVPDEIARMQLTLSARLATDLVAAERAVAELQQQATVTGLEALARPLLRAEGVASSMIEGLQISQRRVAQALFDPTLADATAQFVVGNIRAMEQAIEIGSQQRPITVDDICAMHREMLQITRDANIAGQIRHQPMWIGGQSSSPRNAEFVPPPAEEVPGLMQDLAVFVNRSDLPAIIQAAVAHAQFETIHPFMDGNGRIGRCLIHVILRRRQTAPTFIPPVSVILATNSKTYVRGLTSFRAGDADDWCSVFIGATRTAAERATQLAEQLATAKRAWYERAKPRGGSTAARILDTLPAEPVLDVASVHDRFGVSEQAARLALIDLAEAGIIRQLNVGRYRRAYAATEVFDLVNRFEAESADSGDRATRRPRPARAGSGHIDGDSGSGLER